VIGSQGLLTAIAEGTFGVTKRSPDGGRGLDGVVQRAEGYFNPAASMLEAEVSL
jgi:beta-lysine 5,6-aminomutase alpha subunit